MKSRANNGSLLSPQVYQPPYDLPHPVFSSSNVHFSQHSDIVSCRSFFFFPWVLCSSSLVVRSVCLKHPVVNQSSTTFWSYQILSSAAPLEREVCVRQAERYHQIWQGSACWTEEARCPDRTERCCTTAPLTGGYSLRMLEEAVEKKRSHLSEFFSYFKFILDNSNNKFCFLCVTLIFFFDLYHSFVQCQKVFVFFLLHMMDSRQKFFTLLSSLHQLYELIRFWEG